MQATAAKKATIANDDDLDRCMRSDNDLLRSRCAWIVVVVLAVIVVFVFGV